MGCSSGKMAPASGNKAVDESAFATPVSRAVRTGHAQFVLAVRRGSARSLGLMMAVTAKKLPFVKLEVSCDEEWFRKVCSPAGRSCAGCLMHGTARTHVGEFHQASPRGVLPVLCVRDANHTTTAACDDADDLLAVIRWLDHRYPAPPLHPLDVARHAHWMDVCETKLKPAISALIRACRSTNSNTACDADVDGAQSNHEEAGAGAGVAGTDARARAGSGGCPKAVVAAWRPVRSLLAEMDTGGHLPPVRASTPYFYGRHLCAVDTLLAPQLLRLQLATTSNGWSALAHILGRHKLKRVAAYYEGIQATRELMPHLFTVEEMAACEDEEMALVAGDGSVSCGASPRTDEHHTDASAAVGTGLLSS